MDRGLIRAGNDSHSGAPTTGALRISGRDGRDDAFVLDRTLDPIIERSPSQIAAGRRDGTNSEFKGAAAVAAHTRPAQAAAVT